MKLRVLDATDSTLWDKTLNGAPWPDSDIYFTSAWYRHWQREGYGDGRALLVEDERGRCLYPGRMRPRD